MRDLTRLMLRIGMVLFLLAGCVFNVNQFAKLTKDQLKYEPQRYRNPYYNTYGSSTRIDDEEYDSGTNVSSTIEYDDDSDYDF